MAGAVDHAQRTDLVAVMNMVIYFDRGMPGDVQVKRQLERPCTIGRMREPGYLLGSPVTRDEI